MSEAARLIVEGGHVVTGDVADTRWHRADVVIEGSTIVAIGPDAAAGEITDKGYIAQALARSRRAEAVARLFADPPPPEVMVFD